MGRSLIIPDADFSAVALEQIELPFEMDAITESWINASGNTFNEYQQKAIQKFIKSIGVGVDGSLYSKLHRLWLPMLANNKLNALVDYRNDFKIYESYLTKNPEVFNDRVELKNHGLISISEDNSTRALEIDDSLSIDTHNFSMFMLNTEEYNKSESGVINHGGVSITGLNKGLSTVSVQTSIQLRLINETEYVPTFNSGLYGGMYSNNTVTYLYPSGQIINRDVTIEEDTYTGIKILAKNAGSNIISKNEDSNPIGVVIISSVLSDDEALLLKKSVDELFKSLMI